MRSAVAAKPAFAQDTPTITMPAAQSVGASQTRKTMSLFVALAAVLIAGAFAFRMFKAESNGGAAAQMQTPAAAPPRTLPRPAVETEAKEVPPEAVSHNENIAPEQSAKSSKVAVPETGVGDLRITSNPPGAQVSIDGVTQAYYVTPFNTPPIKSGTHSLTATIAGLPPQTREVEVFAHRRTITDFQLTGDKAIYNIASAPQGAEILIDGLPAGTRTPAQIPLKAGAHKITFRMEGFDPVELMTQSAPGEMVNVAPRLQMRNSVDISGQGAGEIPSLGALARMRRPGSVNEIPEGKGAVVVRTRPKGVTIVVDGYTVPRVSPFRFPIRTGSHTVVLQKPGFQSVTRIIQVEEGKISEIDELLLPQ